MELRLGRSVLRGVRPKKNGGRKNRESPIFSELQMSELKLRPPRTIYQKASRLRLLPDSLAVHEEGRRPPVTHCVSGWPPAAHPEGSLSHRPAEIVLVWL